MSNQNSAIRFSTFPRTEPPPHFTDKVVEVFREHEELIATGTNAQGMKSDEILAAVRPELVNLGFDIEAGKTKDDKIERPVFYGENGNPTLRYQIDGYHPEWRCGIEVEAGRGGMGNAVYRDLVQASLMVAVDYLCLAVANAYRYKSGGKTVTSRDYEKAKELAEAIYGHRRLVLPYSLILIGY